MNKQIPNGGGTPVTSETPHPELMSLQPKLAGEPLCIKTLASFYAGSLAAIQVTRIYIYIYIYIYIHACMYIYACIYMCMGGDRRRARKRRMSTSTCRPTG